MLIINIKHLHILELKNEIRNFIVNNELSGIDRVVPIGQALDMSFYWDGYDLNKILSRIVDIK